MVFLHSLHANIRFSKNTQILKICKLWVWMGRGVGGSTCVSASRHFEATLERSLNEAATGHQVFIIAMKESWLEAKILFSLDGWKHRKVRSFQWSLVLQSVRYLSFYVRYKWSTDQLWVVSLKAKYFLHTFYEYFANIWQITLDSGNLLQVNFWMILILVPLSSCKHVFLERELLVHQGCVRHPGQQDDRVDGPRWDGHSEGVRLQGLHVGRV